MREHGRGTESGTPGTRKPGEVEAAVSSGAWSPHAVETAPEPRDDGDHPGVGDGASVRTGHRALDRRRRAEAELQIAGGRDRHRAPPGAAGESGDTLSGTRGDGEASLLVRHGADGRSIQDHDRGTRHGRALGAQADLPAQEAVVTPHQLDIRDVAGLRHVHQEPMRSRAPAVPVDGAGGRGSV